MANDEQPDPDVVDLNFEKESLHKLYLTGTSREINPKRWERVRQEIRFEDVVADLTGHSGTTAIHCPFHGTDSRPSFWLYRGSNDGWCFGCPPRSQYYDQVRFVARYLDMSRPAALRWLEKKWDLPPLPDEHEDEEDEPTVQLQFEDLQEPYILRAIKQVQEFKDVELAEDYLRYYFQAIQQLKFSEDAKKEGEWEDAGTLKVKAATTLARVLGKEEIDRIFARKEARR
jgi:hypothetical protein